MIVSHHPLFLPPGHGGYQCLYRPLQRYRTVTPLSMTCHEYADFPWAHLGCFIEAMERAWEADILGMA